MITRRSFLCLGLAPRGVPEGLREPERVVVPVGRRPLRNRIATGRPVFGEPAELVCTGTVLVTGCVFKYGVLLRSGGGVATVTMDVCTLHETERV